MTGAGIIIEMPAAVKNRNRMSLTPEDGGSYVRCSFPSLYNRADRDAG